MKIIISLLLIFSSIIEAYSQDDIDSNIRLKEYKFSINLLLNPSFSYEQKLSEKQSLKYGIGISPIIDENWDAIGMTSFLSAAYRRYYSNDDSKLSYNSGSYYGIKAKVILDAQDVEGNVLTPDKAGQIVAIWGLQKNYQKGIYWGVTVGPGIAITNNYFIEFSLLIDLQLGFNL